MEKYSILEIIAFIAVWVIGMLLFRKSSEHYHGYNKRNKKRKK